MTIDKEYARKMLNQYADVAMEVSAVKQEIIKERDINNDDKFSWREQNTIKRYMVFNIC